MRTPDSSSREYDRAGRARSIARQVSELSKVGSSDALGEAGQRLKELAALYTHGRFGPADAPELVASIKPKLVKLMFSGSSHVRDSSARALRGSLSEQEILEIAKAMPTVFVEAQKACAIALTGVHSSPATDALLRALRSHDSSLASHAAEALSGNPDPRVAKELASSATRDHPAGRNETVKRVLKQSLAERPDPEAIALVCASLRSASWTVRSAALGILSGSTDKQAIDALVATMMDPLFHYSQREASAKALAGTSNRQAQRALISNLEYAAGSSGSELTGRMRLANASADSLKGISNRESLDEISRPLRRPGLKERLLRLICRFNSDIYEDAPSTMLNSYRVRALNGTSDPECVRTLAREMRHPWYGQRMDAAGALRDTQDPRGVAALKSGLSDKDRFVRMESAKSLGASAGRQEVARALVRCLADDSECVAWAAAESLGRGLRQHAGTELEREIVGALLAACPRYGEGSANTFLEALRGSELPQAIGALTAGLSNIRGTHVAASERALIEARGEAVTTAVAARFDGGSEQTKLAILRILDGRDGAAARSVLVKGLGDPSAPVRLEACKLAERDHSHGAGIALLACLSDPDREVAEAAAEALRDRAEQGILSALLDGLNSSQLETRALHARALAGSTQAGVVERLIDLLGNDKAFEVRVAAARSLGSIRQREAVEALLGGLTDPFREVQRACADGLGAFLKPRE